MARFFDIIIQAQEMKALQTRLVMETNHLRNQLDVFAQETTESRAQMQRLKEENRNLASEAAKAGWDILWTFLN